MWQRLLVLAVLVFSGQASAGVNDVLVDKAWLRESVAGQKDAGLMLNLSVTKPARLLTVTSPMAAGGEIQAFMRQHGKMEKRTVASLKLPARSTTRFGAHNVYLVLTGLKQRLSEGDHVPVVLVVEIAGRRQTIEVMAEVRAMDLSYQQY